MNSFIETLNLRQRINWKIHGRNIIQLLLLLSVYPLMLYANLQWFIEDGLIENLQLIILSATFFIALKSPQKQNRNFFIFVALIIIFMIMRETNLGRGYLCKIYLPEQSYCKWSDFKYGYIMEPLRVVYVIGAMAFFFYKKIYRDVWDYIKSAPIFIWDFAFFAIALIGAQLGESHYVDNEIMEEGCETLMYLALTCLIWQYERQKIITKE